MVYRYMETNSLNVTEGLANGFASPLERTNLASIGDEARLMKLNRVELQVPSHAHFFRQKT